jgi:hypothetical protein
MLPSLQYAKVPWLRPVYIISHKSPLDPLLQYHFRIVLKRGVFIHVTAHVRALRVVVRRLLPQWHPIDQYIVAPFLLLRWRLLLILLVSLCLRVTLLLVGLVLMNDEIHVFLYLVFRAHLS